MSELPSYSALAGADVAAIYGLMSRRAESTASTTYEFTWQRDQALLKATDGALGDAATGLTGAEARKPQLARWIGPTRTPCCGGGVLVAGALRAHPAA